MSSRLISYSQAPLLGATLQFPCADNWLSSSGATAHWEDEQGVLLLYGYIHNPDFNSTPSYWINLHLQSDTKLISALNQLDGAFNLILLNKQQGSCTVMTDRLGGQRLYYQQTDEGIWLSPEPAIIATRLPNRTFDSLGLMEAINFRWLCGSHSLIEGMAKLVHAAIIQLSVNSPPVLLKRFGLLPARINQSEEKPTSVYVKQLHQLLLDNIRASVRSDEKVAVLLSGGVDSSILLGLCCQLGLNVVAITPLHIGHSNPELETAKTFARQMKVEHRILSIADADVAALYSDTVQQLYSAPRAHSTLSLLLLMRQLNGEFDKVLYGEGADTLFGSNAVKHFAKRFNKHQVLKRILHYLPGSQTAVNLLPKHNRLRQLANFSVPESALAVGKLALTAKVTAALHDKFNLQKTEIIQQLNIDVSEFSSFDSALRYLKQLIISNSVTNHFYELETLASANQLKLVSPFVSWPVLSYAANLPNELYFGGEFVKPVLRKLGEQFYTPELMYLPKVGFPVPYKNWLTGPLSQLMQEAALFFNVPPAWLDEDDEFAWTLGGFYILAKNLQIAPVCLAQSISKSE
jgi:asparagine synthase (glutamine-hydrolysing)